MTRRSAYGVLASVLVAGLALRLWNIGHGLPYVFNVDEDLHFVSVAVRMLESHSLNPHYFENPPALTYLFYVLFKVRFGVGFPFGPGTFVRAFANDPGSAYLLARVAVALIGTLVAGLVYWAGARFYGRRVGLLAAALLSFAFLAVFYSKLALNDVVTMAPLTAGLVGCLLVYERGRSFDWILAGAGIGLATATKYTAGAMLLTLLLAALFRVREKRATMRDAALRLALTLAVFGAVFIVLNPFALFDAGTFMSQIGGQSGQASSAKLGQGRMSGWLYYLWTLTWGFGWLPMLAAGAGAVLAFRNNRTKGLILIAFPILLFGFLGAQGRFFGRWLLPIYPALAILASYAVVRLVESLSTGRRQLALLAGATALLCLQPVAASIRVSSTLGRTDTRAISRDWLVQNVPRGTRLVVEPFVPAGFLRRAGRPGEALFHVLEVQRPFQIYESKLRPNLVDDYRRDGYCWVVTGSDQKQRGLKARLKNARAYYAALDEASSSKVTISPYYLNTEPSEFSFDWSFNYYPRAYARPGPLIEIHRLSDCRISRTPATDRSAQPG